MATPKKRKKLIHLWEFKVAKPRRYSVLVQATNIRTARKMLREAGYSKIISCEQEN
jgi:hypothetical protein